MKSVSDPVVLLDRLSINDFVNKLVENSNEAEIMVCDLCSERFSTKSAIEKHLNSHDAKFKCIICGFKAATKNSLKTHKEVHSKKLECPICHKLVGQLKPHMETHDRKIPCPICKKMLTKGSMNAHKKIHLNKNCTKCKETFRNSDDLRRYVHRY